MKRYRYLILLGVLFLGVLIYYGTYRVISINIGNKGEVTTDYFDIENTIDLFDTTQVHDIKILMTEEEYQDMIDTYSSTSEKDWYKTDVIIDGVLISDVGIRLKGNSSLRGLGGGNGGGPSFEGLDRGKGKNKNGENNMMGGFHGNMKRPGGTGGRAQGGPGGFPGGKNGSGNTQNLPAGAPEGREDMPFPGAFEGGSFGPGMMSGDSISYDSQLPLFIKFNKYVDQTYEGHEMISLRVGGMGSDETLLAEPYSYELYQEAGQPAPDSSYGSVQIDGEDPELFIISELPEDDYYISKWFGDDNGVLYKAGNFVDFSYQGEDPTLYADSFSQKTRVNDYDLSPLIRMLKFVTESDDEEFEEKIDNYIDVESVLTLLAIDDFVGNNDSFGGMGSNYYLYYHLGEQKFYLLTWDQNLAFGGMGGGFGGGGPGGMGGFPGFQGMGSGNFVPLGERGDGEAEGIFSGEVEKILSPSDSSFQKGAQESDTLMDSSLNAQNDENGFPEMPDFEGFDFGSGEMPTPPDFQGGEMGGFPGGDFPGGDNGNSKGGPGRNGDNTLKTRLLANEKFKAMYDEIYAQIEEIALNSDFSENFFSEWSKAFNDYSDSENLVSESSYSQGLEKLKSYLESKKS